MSAFRTEAPREQKYLYLGILTAANRARTTTTTGDFQLAGQRWLLEPKPIRRPTARAPSRCSRRGSRYTRRIARRCSKKNKVASTAVGVRLQTAAQTGQRAKAVGTGSYSVEHQPKAQTRDSPPSGGEKRQYCRPLAAILWDGRYCCVILRTT